MSEIFERVSVRKFLDKPVEPEKILKILKAAMAAPSAGNQQPWEFYVVRNEETKAALSKCSLFARPAAKAPVVIVPCMRREGLRFQETREIDLSAATENMLLEITALGLGGVWLGIAPVEERMRIASEAIGLPEGLEPFALVALGYPAEGHPQQDRYEESRVHFID